MRGMTVPGRQVTEVLELMTKAASNAALSDFLRRHKIYRKTAEARRILSAPFSTTLGTDEMDESEREMKGVKYWKDRKGK